MFFIMILFPLNIEHLIENDTEWNSAPRQHRAQSMCKCEGQVQEMLFLLCAFVSNFLFNTEPFTKKQVPRDHPPKSASDHKPERVALF